MFCLHFLRPKITLLRHKHMLGLTKGLIYHPKNLEIPLLRNVGCKTKDPTIIFQQNEFEANNETIWGE